MKRNNQLNLYFDENIHQKKNNKNLDERINVIISIFLLNQFINAIKTFTHRFREKKSLILPTPFL